MTFNIDANGILNVTAKDKGTGKEQSITIQNSGNLSKEDIAKAQAEAEAHAEEDKAKREATDARNTLENMIYQAKKMPDEFKDKISDDERKSWIRTVKEAEKHLKDDDKDELEKAGKELSEKMQSIVPSCIKPPLRTQRSLTPRAMINHRATMQLKVKWSIRSSF